MKTDSSRTMLITKKEPDSSVLRGYMYIPEGNNCEDVKWLCEIPHIEYNDMFDGRKVIDYTDMKSFTGSTKLQLFKFENMFFKKVDLSNCYIADCVFINCVFCDCTINETTIKDCTVINCTICSDVMNSVIKDSTFKHSHFSQMLYGNNVICDNVFHEDMFLKIGVHQNTIEGNKMDSCGFSNVIQHDTNKCSGNVVARPFFQSTCRDGAEEMHYRTSILKNLCGIA